MSDKNARSMLLSEDALGGSYIIFKGCLWLLDDAHVVAILDKVVVNALRPEPSAQAPWTRTIFFTADCCAFKFGVLDRTASHNIVANTANRLNITTSSFFLLSSDFNRML
jgi:hypothetical protein